MPPRCSRLRKSEGLLKQKMLASGGGPAPVAALAEAKLCLSVKGLRFETEASLRRPAVVPCFAFG